MSEENGLSHQNTRDKKVYQGVYTVEKRENGISIVAFSYTLFRGFSYSKTILFQVTYSFIKGYMKIKYCCFIPCVTN